MSALLLDFSTGEPMRPLVAPPAIRPILSSRREYDFAAVAKLLSLTGEARTVICWLRDLHTQCDMPLPKNPRRWAGVIQTGEQAIDSRSRWCALEFDAWLDSRRSPPPAGAMAEFVPPLPLTARADCALRARQLAAG